MARQAINIGSSANDGTGDPLRTAFDKINDNFVELYGSDNDINTLDANLNVNTFAITTGVTNGDITVTPNGTGSIKLGAVKFNGTTISSDDSTIININEALVVDGTASVSGALSSDTSLKLATGATVTGIDNGSLGSSATLLATQGAIKTYVDAQVTAQDLDFACDDSTTLSIDLDSESLQFSGGTGITTAGTANTVTIAIDGTVATLTGSQTLTNKVLTSPTINAATMTGTVTVDSISMADNTITTNASNANLELDASGTGQVRIIPNTTVVGTLNTADITTTGTQTITGTLNVDGVQVKDNKVSAFVSNSNLELSANGSGVVDVQSALTTVGQTVTGNVAITGQADVDNIRINGNTISTTNSNGGIIISPNGTGTISLNAGTVAVPSVLSTGSMLVSNTLFMATASKIQANVTNEDLVLESNGTGSVIVDSVAITDNKISTYVSNANLEITTDGTGTIELQTSTNVTGNLGVTGEIQKTGDLIVNVSGDIVLDADGGDVYLRDGAAGNYGAFIRAGSNDLTIASGSTQAVIFTGANAAFQGDISTPAISIVDNEIKATRTNDDIQIETNGTGVLDLLTPTQATVGSAGSASALPGQPTGYIKIKIAGTMRVVPFYDQA